MDEAKRQQAAASLLKQMERTADQMRKLILGMPPHDLLGYIYAQYMLEAISKQTTPKDQPASKIKDDLTNTNQFLLEYVHAVLATDAAPENVNFDEAQCAMLYELSVSLQKQALLYAVVSSADTKDGAFGPGTADIEYHAKSSWVMLRGNRYQVLEGEFYNYVLAPHNEILKDVYGVGAADIADGFQSMADATRTGQSAAAQLLFQQFEDVQALAAAKGTPLENVMQTYVAENSEQTIVAAVALDDMFRGGIANVSRHTKLPSTLLADLSYRRGEETEFFAAGDFAGTPYRTLPVRKRPLIQIGSDHYAVDPCFTRDAGYRALLYNLLQRRPGYKRLFENQQKAMSEAAFADILGAQLPGATIYREVYYKDPVSKQWAENDTVVLIDDVLFLVEAKAGAAATIASPASDFGRHAQSVQDLVLKAYRQCERFFAYLHSANEVPVFKLAEGKFKECGRLRYADYRVMIPIGLTVESFSPFSTFCKDLPQVAPLLGKYAFVSLSIDDLFVLKRFLPTPGEFAHYMEIRQNVAGMRRAHLFDEFDHLGAYLKKNRFDLDVADQLKAGKTKMIIFNGMSDVVDQSFEGKDWESRPFPTQKFPEELLRLLRALDVTRSRGWLSAESGLRDLGEEGRGTIAKMLADHRRTLDRHPTRYFLMSMDGAYFFIWLQQPDHQIDWIRVNDKASAAGLAVNASKVVGVAAEVSADGAYHRAHAFVVHKPPERTETNAHIYEDAARMANPQRSANLIQRNSVPSIPKQARNAPCSCGSGLKYKRCHGGR